MEKKYSRMRDLCRPDGRYPWSRAYIYSLIGQGRFPAGVKFGGSRMWSAEDLDAFDEKYLTEKENQG